MINVVIISENLKLKLEIKNYLLEANYEVFEGLNQEYLFKIALIIYDMTTSQNNDASFIIQSKTHTPQIPIIVVVNRGDVQSAVQAMRAGASHILEIPVNKKKHLESIREAISQRVYLQNHIVIQQAIDLLQSLRTEVEGFPTIDVQYKVGQTSMPPNKDDDLQIGVLVINSKQEKVFFDKRPIDLTATQFRLLACLSKGRGRVISFEELYFYLHGEKIDRESARISLSSHLSYLRTKLSDVGCKEYLVNIRGRGYVLEAPENINSYAERSNLDLLLERLPVILWSTDNELHVTSALGAGLAKLNLQPRNVIGKPLNEFFQAEIDLFRITTAHQRGLRGESVSYDQAFEGHTFQVYIEPLYNRNGEIAGCMGLAFDITERKEAEEIYQRLVNHSLQGITIFQNNRIVFANPAIAEITGYTLDELISLDDPSKLIYAEDQPFVYENIRKRTAGETVQVSSEFRFLHKDGSLRWVEQTAFLTSFQNQPAIQVTAMDRTKEKQAIEARLQIERMYRILAKNLPQMGVLIFDHDFRYLIAEGQSLEEAGYIQQKVEGKTIWEVLPADRVEALIPYYRTALAGQEMTFEWISTATNKTYEIRTLPLKNEDEQIVAGMFLIQNISKYKNSQF